MNFNMDALIKAGIAAAPFALAYMFVKNDAVKTGAVVAIAMIAARANPLNNGAV